MTTGSGLPTAIAAAARFGADPAGGVTRSAWSRDLLALYDQLAAEARRAGLESCVDEAGNLLLRWDVGTGPALAIGSHLDTVPNGGAYDGALGVLAGLEAVSCLRRSGFTPAQPIWVIAFMDEEGARFGTSLFGSRAFVGTPLGDLGGRADADGVTLRAAMREAGFDFDRLGVARRVDDLGCYLELHIEQGPVLERDGYDMGVVTDICGVLGLRVRFGGEAGHAGTVPTEARRDALVGAARLILAVDDLARRTAGLRATVGTVEVRPGAANVIPADVELSVDLRAASPALLDGASARIRAEARAIAGANLLDVAIAQPHRADPVPLDAALVETLENAASSVGARTCRISSGAGHDAMVLAPHLRAGMLFVPSTGGVSHTPQEHTSAPHCTAGAEALVAAVRLLDGRV